MEDLLTSLLKKLLQSILDAFIKPTPTPVPPTPTPPPTPVPPAPQPPVNDVQALIKAHNDARTTNGLSPLIEDPRLMAAAQKHSDYQATTGEMSHTGRGGSSVGQRVSAEGYRWSAVGENVAAGQRSVPEVMLAWMRSRGHRANILGNYKNIGVGIAKGSNGLIFWTSDFGR